MNHTIRKSVKQYVSSRSQFNWFFITINLAQACSIFSCYLTGSSTQKKRDYDRKWKIKCKVVNWSTNAKEGIFRMWKRRWVRQWVTSSVASNHPLGRFYEPQPRSLIAPTHANLPVEVFINFCHVIDWSSWPISKPLSSSEDGLQVGELYEGIHNTSHSHISAPSRALRLT